MLREFVVMDRKIGHKGPIELKELYQLIDHFFNDAGYDSNEKKHFEKNTDEGRMIEIEVEPGKTVSSSTDSRTRLFINLKITIDNIKDKKVKINNKTKTLQDVELMIRIRAFIGRYYPEEWENRQWFFLLRHFIDKFVYPQNIRVYQDTLKGHTEMLVGKIKNFLSVYER